MLLREINSLLMILSDEDVTCGKKSPVFVGKKLIFEFNTFKYKKNI